MHLRSPSILFPCGGTGAERVPEGYVGLVASGKGLYRKQGDEMSPIASYPRWSYGTTGSTMYGETGSSVMNSASGVTITLIPDTYSVLGTITRPVTIKIGQASGVGYMHETVVRYKIGTGGSIVFPKEIVWSRGAAGGTGVASEYEASIVDGYGVLVEMGAKV